MDEKKPHRFSLRFRTPKEQSGNGTTETALTDQTLTGGTHRRGTDSSSTSIPPTRLRRFTTHLSSLVKPERRIGKAPSYTASFWAIVTATWLNVLLVFIPVSWALHFAIKNDTVVFVCAFFAIIPLAKLLGFATEELSIRVGQTIGGLLNATLGNAVELIVAIIALTKCELNIVQSSLVGSILSNLLLVLGMCFFAGGTRFVEQGFLGAAAQLNSSLLTLSVIAVLLPAAFHFAVTPTAGETDDLSNAKEGSDILKMSHGVAVVLLLIYAMYLFFQLWSHAHIYAGRGTEGEFKSTRYPVRKHNFRLGHLGSRHSNADEEAAGGTSAEGGVDPAVTTNSDIPPETATAAAVAEEEEEEEIPQLNVPMCIILLVAVTVLVAFTAEFLVDSINGLTQKGTISKEWVGLILLPIVGNAAEHVTAVTVSVKDKLTLSLGVAVGSSIQIALFVIPLLVVLGWILGKPLTLLFDPFESVVLFLSVLTVNYVVADGKSNWLEGMILMMLYVIIAVSFWFYPGSDPSATLLTCT